MMEKNISTANGRTDAQTELLAKLSEAEAEAARGEAGADFDAFAKELRKSLQSRFITCAVKTIVFTESP